MRNAGRLRCDLPCTYLLLPRRVGLGGALGLAAGPWGSRHAARLGPGGLSGSALASVANPVYSQFFLRMTPTFTCAESAVHRSPRSVVIDKQRYPYG